MRLRIDIIFSITLWVAFVHVQGLSCSAGGLAQAPHRLLRKCDS
jgi:hypothetical protein